MTDMNSLPTKLAAIAAAAILALGAAACGGDGQSDETSTSAAPGDLTQSSFFRAISDAQSEVSTSHVSMKITANGQTISAEGDVEIGATAADTSMAMTMDVGASAGGTLALRLIGRTFFINLGEKTAGKFAQVDLNDRTNPIAQQFGSITEQLDPSQQLEQFNQAVSSFAKRGEAVTMDGVQAQPYEIVLDTSKLAALADAPTGSGAAIPKTLTYTMFIGPDNLLRRVAADVQGSTTVVDYSRWGQPVDVAAPSADEITDIDLSQLGAS